MKILYLLRHAHSEPREHTLSDFDRPLDETGQKEAEAVAQYLAKKAITFDFVMCSAALRTQETLESLRPFIGTSAIEISENFYNNTDDQILKYLKKIPDEKQKVLYIGHNPGITFAALKLTNIFPEVLKEGVTPATLIGFTLSLDKWADLEWWKGEIIEIFQPPLPVLKSRAPEES